MNLQISEGRDVGKAFSLEANGPEVERLLSAACSRNKNECPVFLCFNRNIILITLLIYNIVDKYKKSPNP